MVSIHSTCSAFYHVTTLFEIGLSSFFTSNSTHSDKVKKSLKFLQLIKTEILHLHKYSQLLLFRVELSCILFPVSICEMLLQLKWNSSVVNSWLDMIWKGKGPRVDSAHQRTNQAIKSEGLFYRILSRHRSGKDMEKLLQHNELMKQRWTI